MVLSKSYPILSDKSLNSIFGAAIFFACGFKVNKRLVALLKGLQTSLLSQSPNPEKYIRELFDSLRILSLSHIFHQVLK